MDISNFISNLGFPIACVVYLVYYLNIVTKQHSEEVRELSKAVNNNTNAFLSLKDEITDLKIELQKRGVIN